MRIQIFRQFLHNEKSGGLVLILCTLISLDPKDPYYRQRKLERILKLADEEKLERLLNLLEETK